jgi:hypothetical protein
MGGAHGGAHPLAHVVGVVLDQRDHALAQGLERGGDLAGLELGPLPERVLEERPEVLLQIVAAGLLQYGRQLPHHVVAETIQVTPRPGLDGARLFTDRQPAFLDGLGLAGQIGLQHLDAPRELLGAHRHRAAAGVHPAAQHHRCR